METDESKKTIESVRIGSSKKHGGSVGPFQATLLGVALVIGGHVLSWNEGLQIGMAEYLLGAWVFDSGVLCVLLSLAEMTSVLPFSGGLYGFVRVTLGPYLGFLVGCCEMLQAVSYISVMLLPASHYLTDLLRISPAYAILFWTILLGGALAINLLGVQVFWRTNTIFICIVMTLMLLYFAVALPCLDCEKYGGEVFDGRTGKDAVQWARSLPFASWFFVGIETVSMACSDTIEPRKTIPRALVMSFTIVLLLASLLIICVGCSKPGIDVISTSTDAPLYYAYQEHLHMTSQLAKALSVPALFVSSSAWMYVIGKQLRSMAESGLFPTLLEHSYGSNKVPYVALFVCAALCCAVCSAAHYWAEDFLVVFEATGFLGTLFVELCLLLGYCVFRVKYDGLPRQFVSPVGVYGAVYGMPVLLLVMLALVAFNKLGWTPLTFLGIYFTVFTVHYMYHVKHQQRFSDEEQRIMFVAYVINANRHTRNKRRRGMHPRGFSIKRLLHPARVLSGGASRRALSGPTAANSMINQLCESDSVCSIDDPDEDSGTERVLMAAQANSNGQHTLPGHLRLQSMSDSKSSDEMDQATPGISLDCPASGSERNRVAARQVQARQTKVFPSEDESTHREQYVASSIKPESDSSKKFTLRGFLQRSFGQTVTERPADPAPASTKQAPLRIRSSVSNMVSDVLASFAPEPATFTSDFIQPSHTEYSPLELTNFDEHSHRRRYRSSDSDQDSISYRSRNSH